MNKQSNKSGKVVLIIVILVIILAGAGAAWYWFMYIPEQEAKEKARLEQLAKEEAERKAREAEEAKQAKYDDFIKNADSEFQAENWENAKSIYSEALTMYPEQEYPQDQISIIDAKLDEIAAIEAAKPGTIDMLRTATGRYYIILSSSIDDDLAMDFAKKLAKKKINVNILQTRDEKHTYFAVSPANFDTREEAEAALSDYSQYGNGLWVLRY
ncbi:SPOR domain-containing protein [Hyphobacterium sp. CCMP332]|nr:SPOR domain-containing protein [Hyphobacterium sp. CCMP332]